MRCACDTDYSGTHCENEVMPEMQFPIHCSGILKRVDPLQVRRVLTFGESSKAAVIVPVFLIIIVILTSAGLYIYYRRNPASV